MMPALMSIPAMFTGQAGQMNEPTCDKVQEIKADTAFAGTDKMFVFCPLSVIWRRDES
jgi:hypothetical protein